MLCVNQSKIISCTIVFKKYSRELFEREIGRKVDLMVGRSMELCKCTKEIAMKKSLK
jgi:hypothetical protein